MSADAWRDKTRRPGCSCEGHAHLPDSHFPDYCGECSCRCNQSAPKQAKARLVHVEGSSTTPGGDEGV